MREDEIEIAVEMCDYKKTQSPNTLYSGGIDPCIAIGAIYNKKGYMIHMHPVGHDYSSFIEPFFEDLRKDVIDKRELKIYVAGGEIAFDDQCKEDMKKGRKIVLAKIVENGYQESVRKIKWCKTDYSQSLRLIISKGRAKIEEWLVEKE